jgi:hypothetical protein
MLLATACEAGRAEPPRAMGHRDGTPAAPVSKVVAGTTRIAEIPRDAELGAKAGDEN